MKKQIQTNEEKYVKMNEPSLKEARKRRGEELNINIFNLDPKYLNLGVTKKYMLKTYGCQGNLADSEKIAGMLELMGFEKTENYVYHFTKDCATITMESCQNQRK